MWIRIAEYVTANTWNTCENTCEYVPYGHAALAATPSQVQGTYWHVFAATPLYIYTHTQHASGTGHVVPSIKLLTSGLWMEMKLMTPLATSKQPEATY